MKYLMPELTEQHSGVGLLSSESEKVSEYWRSFPLAPPLPVQKRESEVKREVR